MPTPPLCASCSEHALAFTPAAVHQKFTSGALIEKRAYSRVVEVRDGQPRGRCAPIPNYFGAGRPREEGKSPLLGLAPGTDYHCAFGCLRSHSVLASSSCRLNTSG